MIQNMYGQLEQHRYKGKIVSVGHLHELQHDIERHYKREEICSDLYQEYLKPFNFTVPATLPNVKSLIIVAVPQPQIQVSFTLSGRVHKGFSDTLDLKRRED